MSAWQQNSSETPNSQDHSIYPLDYSKPGTIFVLNYTEFKDDEPSNADNRELANVFAHELRFSPKFRRNETASMTRKIISRYSSREYRENDCLVCFIMAYGKKDEILTKDSLINLNEFISDFKTSQTLASKPKLFFVQVWNDEKEFEESSTANLQIDVEADLVCYQVEGPKSRMYPPESDEKGSIFIQALCNAIRTSPAEELASILRSVNKSIKQKGVVVSEIKNAMSKKLYFKVCKKAFPLEN